MTSDTFVWYREEFMDRLDELVSFTECDAALGKSNGTVSKWSHQYEDFPDIVCTANQHVAAKKYLVKSEFADWIVEHETNTLEREQGLYRKFRAQAQKVKKRIEAKVEDKRLAERLKDRWGKPQ